MPNPPATFLWRIAGASMERAGLYDRDLACVDRSLKAGHGSVVVAAMDACNARWGRSAVVPAQAGLVSRRDWNTTFEMRTPRYTTQVSELPVAYA